MYGFQHLSQNSDSDSGRFSQGLEDYYSSGDPMSSQCSITGWPPRVLQGAVGFRQPKNPANTVTTKRMKFSRPSWSSNPSTSSKTMPDNLIVAQQLQAKAETRDLQLSLDAIVANVEHCREECQESFEKCAQISHSNLENFSSNVISKISAQVEQFEEATKMLLEKIDSKLLEISSEDRDSHGKTQNLLLDLKLKMNDLTGDSFDDRLNKLTSSVVDQLSSFKSVYENSVQVVHERIQSVSNKVDAIQDLIASQIPCHESNQQIRPNREILEESISLLDETRFLENVTQFDPNRTTSSLTSTLTQFTKPEIPANRSKRALIECDAWNNEDDEADSEDPFFFPEP